MAARSRLCFWLLVLGFHSSIIFHKFSANSHDLSKIKPPRTDNLYLYNHMEENEADGIGLKWYIVGDKSSRRHVGFGTRNRMVLDHRKRSGCAYLFSLIIISGDISLNPGPRARHYCGMYKKTVKDSHAAVQCDCCDKWIHADCVGPSEEEYEQLGQSEQEWFCNSCKIQRENSSRSEECINDQVSEDLYQEIKDRINGSGISVGHVNIRGLVKNLNELRILLNHAKFDVIGITETHLTEDVDSKEVHVEGYVLHRMDRQKNKQGGGCAVYVKEHLGYYCHD